MFQKNRNVVLCEYREKKIIKKRLLLFLLKNVREKLMLLFDFKEMKLISRRIFIRLCFREFR